jgi:hypothetical protein
MNYEQAQNEVNFHDLHCDNGIMGYKTLSLNDKITLMLKAVQIYTERVKQAATAQEGRLLIHQIYDHLVFIKDF